MFKKAEKLASKTVAAATGVKDDLTGKTALEKEQAEHSQARAELAALAKQTDALRAALAQSQLETAKGRNYVADQQLTIQNLREEHAELKEILDERQGQLAQLDAFKAKQAAEEKAKAEAAAAEVAKLNLAEAAKKQAQDSAKLIYDATTSMIVDDGKIVKAVAPFSNADLQILCQVFLSQYGKDLKKTLKSATSGNLRTFLLGLIEDPFNYMASLLHEATSGMGTDENLLISVIAPLSNEEVGKLKAAFQAKYNKDLVKTVESEIEGTIKRVLVMILQGTRETSPANQEQAERDAKTLYDAGQGKVMGTDETPFAQIIGTRSGAHLAAVNAAYKALSKKKSGNPADFFPAACDLHAAIEEEFSGNLEKCLLTVLEANIDRNEYVAGALSAAFDGIGCDEAAVIRLLISNRDRIDGVKSIYDATYGKEPLSKRISSELSGPTGLSDLARAALHVIGDHAAASK
eukprot:TRINITY_DN97_c0_g1_i1.p1 TRINITY_DN97_c0_g1~~TRINITY_DN97_c0_g1_i1.p1  ORF type:complete len:477 (+),score=148.12 TRINITY_DN97_c0_g1_i1:43-1431(+)